MIFQKGYIFGVVEFLPARSLPSCYAALLVAVALSHRFDVIAKPSQVLYTCQSSKRQVIVSGTLDGLVLTELTAPADTEMTLLASSSPA